MLHCYVFFETFGFGPEKGSGVNNDYDKCLEKIPLYFYICVLSAVYTLKGLFTLLFLS